MKRHSPASSRNYSIAHGPTSTLVRRTSSSRVSQKQSTERKASNASSPCAKRKASGWPCALMVVATRIRGAKINADRRSHIALRSGRSAPARRWNSRGRADHSARAASQASFSKSASALRPRARVSRSGGAPREMRTLGSVSASAAKSCDATTTTPCARAAAA